MLRRFLMPALVAVGLLLAVSGAWAAPDQQQAAVQINDNLFAPQTITVPAGTTVTWTHMGKAPHTVTADDESWNSDRLNPGQTFSHTFDSAGTFGYFCQFHGAPGSGMFGTVIVTAAAAAAAPTPAPAAQPTAAPAGGAAPTTAGITLQITAPTSGATVPGPDVTVSTSVSGTTLVPAASATSLGQMHLHYLLDVDPTPYLSGSTPFPTGDPHIVHSASTSVTFTGVASGQHTVTVVLGLSNHTAAQPPVMASVQFSVGGPSAQVPAVQMPGK